MVFETKTDEGLRWGYRPFSLLATALVLAVVVLLRGEKGLFQATWPYGLGGMLAVLLLEVALWYLLTVSQPQRSLSERIVY